MRFLRVIFAFSLPCSLGLVSGVSPATTEKWCVESGLDPATSTSSQLTICKPDQKDNL
jgi:hypothetical protein